MLQLSKFLFIYFYQYLEVFDQKWSMVDLKSGINYKVDDYLSFIVRITSYFQTLILDLVSSRYEVYFLRSPHPFIKKPRLSGTDE